MRNEFWIISTLISIGVIGGFVYNWPITSNIGAARQFPDSRPTESASQTNLLDPFGVDKREQAIDVSKVVAKGDNYLEVSSCDLALDYYLAAYKNAADNVPLLIRIGLAYELIHEAEQAEYFYRRSVQSKTATQAQRATALLAQTRNWLNLGRASEAIEVLSQKYLAMDGDEDVSQESKFQIGYQLANAFQLEARQLLEKRFAVLDRPFFVDCPIEVESTLRIIDNATDELATVDETNSNNDGNEVVDTTVTNEQSTDLTVLQRPGEDASLIVVSGFMKSIAISKLITKIEEQTELEFVLTPDIRPYLIGRTVRIQSSAISLAVLMDVVFRPLSLVWEQDFEANQIRLLPVNLLEQQDLAFQRARQSVRIGRQIIVNFPNNRCRDSIRLAGANLNYLTQKFDAASTILNQMLDELPTGELNATIQLNVGILEKRFNRYELAVERLLAAVDQTANNELQAAAYASIAKIYINQGVIEPAISASSRSLSLTANPEIRGATALDLARGYLINRDPQSANRALFENAATFDHHPEKELALVMGAYARSLGTLSPIAKQRAIETLVIALADVRSNEIEHTVDRIIVAKAFQSIGLPDQAIDTLVITDAHTELNVWNRKRIFELAELLMFVGNKNAAVANYRKITEDLSDLIGKRSQLKLARIELVDKQDAKQCIALCRELWQLELTEKIKSATLRLMGQAYREMGDVDSSVYCFYGMLPDPDGLVAETSDSQ